MPAQPPSMDEASNLSSRLPRTRRGYDPAATDELLRELATKYAELEQECNRLRELITGLETDVARRRRQEELIGKTLLAAMDFAMKTRENARREAELVLHKAGARAVEESGALERLARDRKDAERELERLHQLTQEMQSGLASFLKSTLHELRPEGEQEAGDDASQVPSPSIDETLANALEAALQPEKR